MEPSEAEIKHMIQDDIIERPLELKEPGTYISNFAITDKKWDSTKKQIHCQAANKDIYRTHEPMPASEELRYELRGSDRFSALDIRDPAARKLYTFRMPWGIYCYERMVMGTSPASSEIQKQVKNSINIQDDILVHGKGKYYDTYLTEGLTALQENGLTLKEKNVHLGSPR